MSRFAIEIQLDHPQEKNISDGARGTLRIETQEDCKCRKLVLYCQCGLREPEELDKKNSIEVTVAKWEAWEAGVEYSYPFHFKVDGNWTGKDEQKVPTVEWFFLPEIHIIGEFRSDASIGWILAKNSLLESSSKALEPFDEEGDDSTLFGSQVANADVNLDTKNIDQTDEGVNLVSAELLDGLEELEKVLIDENGDRPTELTTNEGFFISLYFDRADRKYRVGEKISGYIVVRSFGEFKIDRLGLVYQWRTHGRAELEEGEINQITIAKNEKWQVGQLYEYSFSFVIEDGRTTYRGHNHNLDWYIWPELKTEKDRSDSNYILDILKAAETDFLLVAGNETFDIEIDPASEKDQLLNLEWARVPYSSAWFLLVSAALVSVSGLIFIAYLAIDGQISFWAWLILSILSLLPLAWVYTETSSYKLAELRTGPVDVQISSQGSSNSIRSEVQFQPRKKIHIERLKMELVVKEKVSRVEGTRTITNEFPLFSRFKVNSIKQEFMEGTTFYSKLAISDIPDSVPTNKKWGSENKSGGKHEIFWTVTISIMIDNWYDWKRNIPIKVMR